MSGRSSHFTGFAARFWAFCGIENVEKNFVFTIDYVFHTFFEKFQNEKKQFKQDGREQDGFHPG